MNKIIYIVVVLFVLGCSKKNDAFLNRKFHATTAKYNILYNGNLALENEIDVLNTSYSENFWDIIPVERIEVDEDKITLPGETSSSANFEKAEDKAIKAVQKHSMLIKAKQKNPQIDEAYLLLGKTRYFDSRFVEALDAFNYILYKNPDSDKINEAKIWREKTNLRLEYTEVAIENLKKLLKNKDIEKENKAEASATLAQAYINQKHNDSAINSLEIAAKTTQDKNVKGRYYFILSQLYNLKNDNDSEKEALDKIIKLHRKTERPYYLRAKLANAKYNTKSDKDLISVLIKMEKNFENKNYLDYVRYEIGNHYKGLKNDSIAENYYKKSIASNGKDKFLKAKNYDMLATIAFDDNQYKKAGAYYDTTLTYLTPKTRIYRKTEKKKNNLNDVVFYEDVAQKSDSIINIASLSKKDQEEFYQLYIDELKKAEQEKLDKLNKGTVNSFSSGKASRKKTFYFYNPNTLEFGKQDFIKRFGNRKLEDNWRRADKTIINESVKEGTEITKKEDKFSLDFYLNKIPKSKKQLDSIKKSRDFAYYQLGLLYKEKFKEYELAASRLETLLAVNTNERLTIPSKYQLAIIYNELGKQNKARKYKNDIIKNHSKSKYAQLLSKNKNALQSDDDPIKIYEDIYALYTQKKYKDVITKCDVNINLLVVDPIVPKLELLKATCIGKIKGKEEYKKALNFVSLNYPSSQEGKKAQELYKKL